MPADVAVAYCVPPILSGLVHLPFVRSLYRVMAYDGGHNQRIANVIDSVHAYIPEARSQAVRNFLELPAEVEWLWFLDYDVVFNPDALDKLLAVADPVTHPIVCALYFIRMADDKIWPGWLEENPETGEPRNVSTVVAGELREMLGVSMGCTVIHRSVFTKLQEIYSPDPWPWYGHDLVHARDGRTLRASEDHTFCMRARKAGFSCWGYGGVHVDHVKTEMISWHSFGRDDEAVSVK